jgi:hypothetical protein
LSFLFLSAFNQPITAAAMCTVAINVLEPGAFNPKSQYFIALFNKISWLYEQQPRMNVTSIEGCNSDLIGRDFMDNSSVSTSQIKNATMWVQSTKINENIITTTWKEDHGNLGYYCICNKHNLNQLWHTWISKPTSKFNIETIYVCYIVMKFYVLVYTNISLFFHFLCIITMQYSFSYHGFYTLTTMSKLLKIKISVFFTILFHKILYWTSIRFHQMKMSSKVINTNLYTNQKKIK